MPGPVQMVEAAGTRIAVAWRGRPLGDGTPLLCLHAIGHGSGDFGPLADRLEAQGAPVALAAIDWPGQGRSPADALGEPASAGRYAEILAALVPLLFGDRRPVLLGNSIGGAAAIRAASSDSRLTAGLLLCNPGGLAPVDAVARRFCLGLSGLFRAGARGAWWYPALFRAYYRWVLPQAPERRAEICAAAGASAGVLAEAWASFAEQASDLRAALGRVAVPVQFAWARDDRIVSWARSAAAVAASGADVRMFPGGHAPFLEAPDLFVPLLLDALQRWRVTAPGACGG